MNDEEIRLLMINYVNRQMELVIPDQMEGYDHEFSTKYKRRIKKLFWSEKYFGCRIGLGYAVRRVAIVAIVALSLVTAGEVSARVFGFRPWEYLTSYIWDVKMEEKSYVKPQEPVGENQVYKKAVRELPSYIPTMLQMNTEDLDNKETIYADWFSDDGKVAVQYTRTALNGTVTIVTDGEYTKKKSVLVKGYQGYVYTKKEETWLIWDDTDYNYNIFVVGLADAEKELLKMADSLY